MSDAGCRPPDTVRLIFDGTPVDYVRDGCAPSGSDVRTAAVTEPMRRHNARLRSFVAELLPYAADSCPDACRYGAECGRDGGGWPGDCPAYGHLARRARAMGVAV